MSDKPLGNLKESIERLRNTASELRMSVRETTQNARIRPLQSYKQRGGGPVLASLRTNLEKRPKILDRIREARGK